jgi:hypothetical protein
MPWHQRLDAAACDEGFVMTEFIPDAALTSHVMTSSSATKFLFWNINRKPLAELVAQLADVHAIDVLILAESGVKTELLLRALNSSTKRTFHYPVGLSKYITIFTRFSRDFLQPSFESERISIRRLALPARSELLIAAVHFPSKLHWSTESQAFECTELARRLETEETRAGHQRTVLLGIST